MSYRFSCLIVSVFCMCFVGFAHQDQLEELKKKLPEKLASDEEFVKNLASDEFYTRVLVFNKIFDKKPIYSPKEDELKFIIQTVTGGTQEGVKKLIGFIIQNESSWGWKVLTLFCESKLEYVRRDAIGAIGELGERGAILEVSEDGINKVVKLISDNNLEIRGLAVATLGILKITGKESEIAKLLLNPDSALRAMGVWALGELCAKDRVNEIIQLLHDKDEHVRLRTIEALGKIGARESIEPLKELLVKETDTTVRKILEDTITLIESRQKDVQIKRLVNLLGAGDKKTRELAQSDLLKFGVEPKKFLEETLSGKNKEIKHRALFILRTIEIKERIPDKIWIARPEIINDLMNEDLTKRILALTKLLGEDNKILTLNDDDFVSILEEICKRDNQNKKTLIENLRQKNERWGSKIFVILLFDKDESIRRKASDGLTSLPLDETQKQVCIKTIIKWIEANKGEKNEAILVLGEFGAKESVELLRKLLTDKDATVRINAICSLGKLRAKQAINEIKALLKDEVIEVRTKAIWALGELQAKEMTGYFIELLKHSNPDIRCSAVESLGKLGAKEAIVPLKDLLKIESRRYISDEIKKALGILEKQ